MAVHAGISSFFIIIKKGSMPAFLSTAILPLVTTPSFILPVYSAVSAVSLPLRYDTACYQPIWDKRIGLRFHGSWA